MLKSLLSIFLKENCPLCERATEDAICYDCYRQISSYQIRNSNQFWQGDLPLWAWGGYEGKLKQAIAALKYHKNPQIGQFLGLELGKAWQQSSVTSSHQSLTVIPIPLHPQKQKERGFNQAEVIAQGFCQITGYSLQAKGLTRVRQTQAMFGLNPQQRQQNLKQAFKVGLPLQKQSLSTPILLLDDIYTTGTTATEAARSLRNQGLTVVGIAVVATPKRKR